MARPRTDPAILEASGAYAKNPNRRPVDMPVYIPGAPEMPPIVAENEQENVLEVEDLVGEEIEEPAIYCDNPGNRMGGRNQA